MKPISEKRALNTALAVALGTGFTSTAQAALSSGAILSFTGGAKVCELGTSTTTATGCIYDVTSTTGSWFSMDNDGNGRTTDDERTPITPDQGLIIGQAQPTSGQSHSGAPTGSEATSVDKAWQFFSNTGMHNTVTAITVVSDDGAGNVVLDMAGWRVDWNGIEDINMGGDTANFSSDTGQASLTCYSDAGFTTQTDCADGTYFKLNYAAHVPLGDASGFGGVPYALYLEGSLSIPNNAPVATNVSTSTTPGSTVSWTPTVSDADGDALICSIVSQPATGEGTATVSSDCSSGSYDPGSFTGTTTFTYKANDGSADSNTATVTVTVSATPPPVANNDSATTNTGTAVTIDVTSNDTDADGTVDVTTVSASNGSHGTTSVNTSTGVVTYTPDSGFAGTDTFTYRVKDNDGQWSGYATVTVTVRATAPVTDSGTFAPGDIAASVGSTSGGGLTASDVGTDDALERQCIGGCFDFTISGISSGGTVDVVLPLSEDIPQSAVYRKLIDGTWQNFDTSGDNAVASAAATATSPNVVCPTPGSPAYSPGLAEGDRCVQLTIVDGGPNDADGLANGIVKDPGGIGVLAEEKPDWSTATSGCTITRSADPLKHAEWWLLGGLLALLGVKRRKA